MAETQEKATKPALSEAQKLLLARRLKGRATEEPTLGRVMPRPAGVKVPISVDQYRIWLHHFMQPDLPTYNEPVTLFHSGPLDTAVLQASLEEFVVRREIWRTSFEMEDGTVQQVVHPKVSIPVQFFDLTGIAETDREAEDNRLAKLQAKKPFKLTEVPLFRVLHTRMSPTEDRVHFVVHHIIFDGTAIQTSLVPELADIYKAFLQGEPHGLPPRELQYADYTLWREKQIASPAMERSKAFWREELAGELPVLRLPTDRSRPPLISQRGSMEMFEISPELTSALREMGRKHNSTLYMVMLASLQVLLFRYSGSEDVILGTGADGRRVPELEGMMGYVLDTFPVRNRAKAEMPFLQFLSEVKTSLLRSLDAADVPFDQIVQAAGLKRDPSYHPIFQTFFSFLPPATGTPEGWTLQPKMVDTGSAKFDLYFETEEREEDTAACILYNTDLFDAPTIRRIIGHWQTLLEGISRAPETTLGTLPLLTAAERQTMLVDWNATEAPLPASTMHDQFHEQVLRTPDAIAVQFEKKKLTYAQLDDLAERYAVLLQAAGAGPGKLVAICIDRSENLLAGLLGILKTGATYLPLDPGTPLARITMCLEDGAPEVLLTQESILKDLPQTGAKVLTIEKLVVDAAALPAGSKVPAGVVGPNDSAYIIHTSGSTGRPKAVELPHGAVVNLLLSMQREPGLKPTDTLIAVTTISFDIAVLELFMPIITGARVVIAPRTTAMDPFELSDLIDEVGCTVLQATPATWRGLMAIDWPGHKGLKVLCGGEALPRDLAEKLLARDLELWNVYGPTETTIWSTCFRVQHGKGSVPIGRPIANTTTYILDTNEQPVPVGVPGELLIGGEGLAKGYRGQPELTAEKFIKPAIAEGKTVYRTGDYAVYRADGTIECQGRADNQVKVRGYRIELEEVELNLSAHPRVAAAAARVWKDDIVGGRLAGYVVGKNGPPPDVRELRQFMQSRVPEYMIPTEFVALDALPMTPNGKTDRKALPAPGTVESMRAGSDAPMSAQEERLAKIWAEVLGVKSVHRDDNFFDLGGHSLMLVLLFSRINKEFATKLPITTIFDAQTLSELAKVMGDRTDLSRLVPVQTAGAKPPLFIAHSYLLYRALSSSLGYDQPVYGLRELETDGDMSILERAERYWKDIRSVQPHGPYRIAGWCAAGPLAVEIAKQVINAGEQVAVLELFDSWLPGYAEALEGTGREQPRLTRWKRRIGQYLASARRMKPKELLRALWMVPRRTIKEARDNFYMNNWARAHQFSERFNVVLPQFMHNTSLQTFAALREFRPEPLPVHITLIRASETRKVAGGTAGCGWEQVAMNGVDVLWAPGDHETMFRDDNLRMTADLVARSLAHPGGDRAVETSYAKADFVEV